MSASDLHHMAQALMLARRGLGQTWPNPSVGTVIVSPNADIVGRGQAEVDRELRQRVLRIKRTAPVAGAPPPPAR